MTPADDGMWRKTTLGDIGNYVNGRGFKKAEWSDHGRMIIRIQDLTGTGRAPNYFAGYCDEKHVVRDGDLLISWAATLDAFIWSGDEAVLNQHIFKVESRINRRFHYYLVKAVLSDVRRRAHGSGMVHVTKREFEDTPVQIPTDTADQGRIADQIDAHLSRLQAAAIELQGLNPRIRRYRASVLEAAVEGRLAAPIDGDPQALDPSTWAETTLEDLGNGGIFKDGDWVESKDQDPHGDVRLIQLADIGDGRFLDRSHRFLTAQRAAELRCTFLEANDVLIARMPDPLGRACRFPGIEMKSITAVDIAIARPAHDEIDPRWLVIAINAPKFRSAVAAHARGSTRLRISRRNLGRLPLPLPPRRVQARLADEVERRLSLADAIDSSVGIAARRLGSLRDAVLHQALTPPEVPNQL